MADESFLNCTQKLIRKIPGNIIPKVRYLVNNILEITVSQEKVCNLGYDVIPKLFAYEDNVLYTDFLNISKSDSGCVNLYKSCVGDNYDEFMFISISFLNFIFKETEIKDLIISDNFNNKKIRIIKRDVLDKFLKNRIDIEDEEYSGNINLSIPIH